MGMGNVMHSLSGPYSIIQTYFIVIHSELSATFIPPNIIINQLHYNLQYYSSSSSLLFPFPTLVPQNVIRCSAGFQANLFSQRTCKLDIKRRCPLQKKNLEAELSGDLIFPDHLPPFPPSRCWACIQPDCFVLCAYE